MVNRNYEIFSGDVLVAIWKDNELNIMNEELLPLYLKRIHSVIDKINMRVKSQVVADFVISRYKLISNEVL